MTPKEKAIIHFKELLHKNEHILWAGTPEILPYSISIIIFQIIGLMWFFIDLPLLFQVSSFSDFCFYVLHLTPFWISCYLSLNTYKSIHNIVYAYSKNRIFIKDGTGANYTIIEFFKIINIECNSNLIENKYQTGSIYIYSGKKNNKGGQKPDILYSIKTPIDVLVNLKKLNDTSL